MKQAVLVLLLVACAFGARLPAAQRVGFNHGRIIGGSNAAKGQFPYQVSLQFTNLDNSSHACGGSIISASTILTAGQCVTEIPILGHYEAVAGDYNFNSNEGTEQRIRVSRSIVHPDFGGGVSANDIALMILASPLQLNSNVAIIALPSANSIPSGSAVLFGWGSVSTSSTASMPSILQTATLPLLTYAQCEAAVGEDDSPLATTNVCTGPLDGGFSACSGDSGGPLAQVGDGGSVVIGIVSWDYIPCGSVGAPSVYTRVSAFLDFINANKV